MRTRGAPMLENRTRERLTGGAILVAVIVLLVPELLSRPHQAAPQPAAALDEAPFRSYTLSIAEGQPGAVAPTADGARASDLPPAQAAARVTPVARAKAEAPARPETPSRTAARGAEAPAAPGASGMAGTAAPAPAARRTSTARSGHAESAPAHGGKAAGAWAVQVGSFSSRQNADRLVRSLKLKGYGAFVTESSSRGRKWYRVRVGPQRDRAAADAIAARLRSTGLRGAVAQRR
jgi:DedD protein